MLKFHIAGSSTPRPAARSVIYCDGGTDDQYREGVDLELSHWVPNRTPARFKADTSTEICLRFVAAGGGDHDLVVNNHVDVDGLLAVFTLVHGASVLPHRATLAQTAAMGDFWAWGEPQAQALFQGVTRLLRELQAAKTDAAEIYERGFAHVRAFLAGEASGPEADEGLAALRASETLVERGDITRRVLGDHFAHYIIPRRLAEPDLARALRVPGFNAPLSSDSLLLPQVRARFDRERVHLVSVESPGGGWHHDLWYPGYCWAETPHSWRPPGLRLLEDSNAYAFDHPALSAAVAELANTWSLATHLTPFSTLKGRGFPVVLSSIEATTLDPGIVGPLLSVAF
jgi:hypothetical protein